MTKKEKHNINISKPRDTVLYIGNEEHVDRITKIGKAISSPIRLQILDLIKSSPLSLQEIADKLHTPLSSTALHVQKLEEAKLVVTENQPGTRGTMRVCVSAFNSFTLASLNNTLDAMEKTVSVEMPIGNYYDFDITPFCGMADKNGAIGSYDSIYSFYSPQRTGAQLLWFTKGYLEYRFPNIINPLLPLSAISFSMELCSEAAGFLEHYPSDITILINDIEIATYRSPGDFGARRGKITPKTWANGQTQYGLLKTFFARKDGCYIDGHLQNMETTLQDLRLDELPYISLKIAIKEDAKHVGGINLFGKTFGDYPQDIIMNIIYE